LSEYHSSLDLFCMIYLDKCKEEGLFEEFVGYYIKSFKYGKDHDIQSVNDLFTQMTLVKFENNETNKKLFNNWKVSFEELYKETKILFVNHPRLHINRKILYEIQDYPGYEIKRLEVNCSPDQVVVYTH
jgi:hypothetical protein